MRRFGGACARLVQVAAPAPHHSHTTSLRLAHTNAFSHRYTCPGTSRVSVLDGRCTQNRVHAVKNSERSQRSVPGTSYLELKNSTNRAYSRARPIRSPSLFLSFFFFFFFSLLSFLRNKGGTFRFDQKKREGES